MRDFDGTALGHYPFAEHALPIGWVRTSLSDIGCDVGPGFASGAHTVNGSGIAHLRPMNVDRDGKINLDVLKSVASTGGVELAAGDILFNNTNSPELIGKTAVVGPREEGFAFSNHMTRVRPPSASVSAYFAHQLHFLWMTGYMKYRCTNHVNQASISSKTLADTVPILLPPTAEQTRIVDKLEELLSDLDAGVAELKAAQTKLAQYRQSLLKAAVEGRLTEVWRAQHGEPEESGAQLLARILRERRARWEAKQLAKFESLGKLPPKGWPATYPEPEPPDTAGLPELPNGWLWSSLGQCFYVGVGATPSRKQPEYWNGGTPWVSSGEVRFNRITATKEQISELGLRNSSTRINPIGSVMLGMIGEGKTRGQAALLDIEAANNQNCAAIWVAETGIAPEYVYYWLWSRYDETRRGSSGNNQPALNKSIVEAIPFPVPPLSELSALVALVESGMAEASNQESALKLSLRQSAAQRKNILRAAFSGQLVPQDPNDEPASVLLERIRVERVVRGMAQPKARKPRRTAKEAA